MVDVRNSSARCRSFCWCIIVRDQRPPSRSPSRSGFVERKERKKHRGNDSTLLTIDRLIWSWISSEVKLGKRCDNGCAESGIYACNCWTYLYEEAGCARPVPRSQRCITIRDYSWEISRCRASRERNRTFPRVRDCSSKIRRFAENSSEYLLRMEFKRLGIFYPLRQWERMNGLQSGTRIFRFSSKNLNDRTKPLSNRELDTTRSCISIKIKI